MQAMDALDVVGIGNAIVDVIATADDDFLELHAMTKGAMMLVDERRAEAIYASMGSTLITSGGSAGNTIAGIASLGGKTGYIGKVRDDEFGRAFRHDITAAGAIFRAPSAADGPATAHCLILVTPDSQRTMNTYLGACVSIGPADVDEELIAAAAVTYLEGYLYDDPAAKNAFHMAADIAHAAGRKVALSLSDALCVNRHRPDFLRLVDRHVDILFANEAEITALYEAELADAVEQLRTMTGIAAITRSADGSLVVTRDGVLEIPAAPVDKVVDTTGAGDLYAAGFLYALTHGATLERCGRLGSLAASEIISHFGARPQTPLHQFVKSRSATEFSEADRRFTRIVR
ncbi:MAG TPA: adenosine kinase [Candidatus Baltobacteraceae bacterium]|nr:adenosine kinase [Candidatus Baltobacteraceae bacterium]